MPVTPAIAASETEPGYGQLLAVLLRRRYWLLGTFLGVLSLATLYTLLQKSIYQSSMQLLVEPNYQSKKEGGRTDSLFADSNVEIDNSTQLTQMRSSQLLQKAVSLLKPKYPDITAEKLQKSLVLTQAEEDKVKTKIFQVLYADHDPVKTQKVLLAIRQVYQDYNREQQKQRLARGLEFINEQLPVVENQVQESENALEGFRKSRNLVDPELQSKTLVESLTRIQQEQQTNAAKIRDAQARYRALERQLTRSPRQALTAARLSESNRFQGLLTEIQKTELELAKARTRFTDDSPLVQRALERRQRQQDLIQQEQQQVLGGSSGQPDEKPSLSEAQLGQTDVALVGQLAEAQVNLAALQAQAQSLAVSERSLQAKLQQFPGLLAQYGRLQPKVDLNRTTFQQLLKARQELALEIARGGFDWQVVEQPKLGTKVGPDLKRNLLLGAVAGLMLGAIAAFVRDSADDAVHSSDDLKQQASLPLLGMVPVLPRETVPVIIHLPFSRPDLPVPSTMEVIYWQPFREALDLIYKNIQLLPTATGLKSLVVTSALAGEGKSTIALGLAISAARLHQRVLLIDADLRRPSLHKQLDLPNDWGLSTLLATNTPLLNQNGIQLPGQYADISLSVLTAGPSPADPAKLLSSQRMKELMAVFEQNFDLVVLDAPPVLGIVDAILATSCCEGAVMVGRIGQVTRTELNQALAMLSKLNLVGIIANGADSTMNSYLTYEKAP